MKTPARFLCVALATLGLASPLLAKTPDGKPMVLFLAGRPSHGPGEHEHNAGVQLLAKCLNQGAPNVVTKVHLNAEWPSAEELAQADTIVFYADGGGGHFMLKGSNLADITKEMKRGAGFVCLHYAVEFPADKGGPQALDWMGGFFEANWSVNPHWEADYQGLPKHPVTSGVKPFKTTDEWYFHMRFRGDNAGKLTHILSAIAPDSTMSRPDGPHEGNPAVRAEVAAKKPQTTAWAYERPDGARGFGFTGGHFHKGWGNDDQRKLVLNAILWTAKAPVPANGVESKVSAEELEANLDPKGGRRPRQNPAPAPAAAAAGAKALFVSKTVTTDPVPVKVDLKGAKELYLVANETDDGLAADWAIWIEPTLIKADGTKLKLTDLKPKLSRTGWGQLAVNVRPDGNGPMKVKGQAVPFGLSAHAPSVIGFELPADVVAFEGRAGIDDGGTSQGFGATVVFEVYTQNPSANLSQAKAPAAPAPGNDARYGLERAQANMATFKTAEGLQASLFAAEPMVQNPTNIEVDSSGRIWAAETVNYRNHSSLREEGDRIVILEDSNGDGLADKETTFYQDPKLNNVLGLCVLPGPGGAKKGTQVIMSAAPNIWLLTDTDGDDKADRAEVLAKVGGAPNHDHQIHAFSFGPDGKFYFDAGNEFQKLTDADGKPLRDLAGNEIVTNGRPYRQGMVFRADLQDGKLANLESLGWNFRNNYEVCVDSFGNLWQSDNDDDGNRGVRINYVMEFGNYGYTDEITGAGWNSPRTNLESEIPLRHWHLNDPGVVPNLLQTGAGSPTGILFNEGSGLGAAFQNQLIHCDAGPRTVRAYPTEPDGAGFKASMVDILTSTDQWYRPSDVAIAPDGSLYVADWYDPGVGGHAMGDNAKGRVMGRIYRVGAAAPQKPAALKLSSAEGAVTALQSPNKPTQYAAWQSLRAMGKAAEPALLGLWKNANPRLRARALGLLALLPGSETKYLAAGLADADPGVRVFAIRLSLIGATSRGLDTKPLEENRELMGRLVKDASPQVRRQIAVSLRGAKDIAPLWTALALQHDGKDRWYLEALGIGAANNADACMESWLAAVGDKWNTPAGRDILWRLRAGRSADFLAKIISDKSVPAPELPRYLRAFDFLPGSNAKTQALVTLASNGGSDEVVREAISRLKGTNFSANPEAAKVIQAIADKSRGTAAFVEMVRDFNLPNQGQALLDTALAIAREPAASDAVKLLTRDATWEPLVNAAFGSPKAGEVIDLLGSTGTAQGRDRLSALAQDAQQPLEKRQQCVRALARTQDGAAALVALAKDQKLTADLKPAAGSALRLVQYPALAADIDSLFPASAALGGKPLPPVAELAKLPGDAAKGRIVAERAESSCITCHRIGDKGVDFAPALSEIGAKLPKEAIFEAILNPNAGVSMGFETTQLTLRDGGMGLGIVRSETNNELVLAMPGGATARFDKGQIAKREKLPTSLMPSGLNQALSQEDLVNLVEYLSTLKPAR